MRKIEMWYVLGVKGHERGGCYFKLFPSFDLANPFRISLLVSVLSTCGCFLLTFDKGCLHLFPEDRAWGLRWRRGLLRCLWKHSVEIDGENVTGWIWMSLYLCGSHNPFPYFCHLTLQWCYMEPTPTQWLKTTFIFSGLYRLAVGWLLK